MAANDEPGIGRSQDAPSGAPEAVSKAPVSKAPVRKAQKTFRASARPRASDSARPAPEEQVLDLDSHKWYLNRELTWLEFNRRVLYEGQDPRTPLLERVKFLAIVSSNLDEFFMKRIGGLKQQVGAGVTELSVDGCTPEQQIQACQAVVRDLEEQQRVLEEELLGLLGQEGIRIVGYRDLSAEQRAAIRGYYVQNIFPMITPLAMDPAHPFPFISNLSLNLLVMVRYPNEENTTLIRIKVPAGNGNPRFLQVGDAALYVPMEDVMAHNLELLFPGMLVESCELFRVTRNAITERDEEQAQDLLEMIESELRDRKFAPIVRLEIEKGLSSTHRGMLAAELGLDEAADVFVVDGLMAKRDLFQIVPLDRPELHDSPHHPIDHPQVSVGPNLFHTIRNYGPFLLQHPYESFVTSVERFLREASGDPKVLAIKMTLYRTAEKSKIIEYLIDAAQNGKQVVVVMELKARFDESANIRWANYLEEAGIHVSYGVVGLKTHSKVTFVLRRDYDGLRRYAHIGTGNYHSGTARLYCDLGVLSCDPVIGGDLTELFNYLTTGHAAKRNYRKLLPAPNVLKPALIEKIQREIEKHSKEAPGLIQLKMNALEDKDITRALYQASQAGVKVDLIVRDTCRLRPGIPGLSDNVRVISIVGRFLEHTRIFYFRNGGEKEYFIGSADCMTRNLEHRVEVVTPVDDPDLRKLLRQILDIQFHDRRSAWDMDADGRYVQRVPAQGEDERGAQQALLEAAEARYKAFKKHKQHKHKIDLPHKGCI
jgi:polyphosphate kinase